MPFWKKKKTEGNKALALMATTVLVDQGTEDNTERAGSPFQQEKEVDCESSAKKELNVALSPTSFASKTSSSLSSPSYKCASPTLGLPLSPTDSCSVGSVKLSNKDKYVDDDLEHNSQSPSSSKSNTSGLHQKKLKSFFKILDSPNGNKSKKDDTYVLMKENAKGDVISPLSSPTNETEGRSPKKDSFKRTTMDDINYDEQTLSTLGSYTVSTAKDLYDKWKNSRYVFSDGNDMIYEDPDFDEEYYEVKQKYGYCSIILSVIQLFISVVMVSMCGIAPLDINATVGPYPDTFSYWGGKNSYMICIQMEIYRLVTPVFLHSGFVHLLCNLAIQLEYGAFFEREWSSGTWFVIYSLSGLGSTIFSVISQPETISVGATGSLMGLFGAKFAEWLIRSAFQIKAKEDKSKQSFTFGLQCEQLGGLMCSMGILCLFVIIPYIDWAGHAGGLGIGFFVGLMMFASKIESCCGAFFTFLLGLMGFIGGFVFSAYFLLTIDFDYALKDPCDYYGQLYHEGYDCTCKNIFDVTENYDDDMTGTWARL